ncbi:hypothetical protein chiPu_0021729 [Chiloscyllium punctatum]|uniref:C2HC/C3H-type domain-containing protein n=1 Tax=Chiloscyllium punctatum TaxID=137246 RepID=A0A401RL20_CHIPU|nr:hypothetical protein [Chiloscyllium punctatum]
MGPYLQIDPLSPYGKNKSSRKLPPISQDGHDIPFATPQTKLDLLKCQIQQKLEREKQVKLMAIYKQQYQEALYRLRTTYLVEAHSGSYRNPGISEQLSADGSHVQSPMSEDQDLGWTQVTLGPQGKRSAGIDRAHPLRPIDRRHSGLSNVLNFEGETPDWRSLIHLDAPMWPAVTFRPSPPKAPRSKCQSNWSQLRSRERGMELRTSEDSTSPVQPHQRSSQCNNSTFSKGLETRELKNSQQNDRINIDVEISKKESLIQGRLRKIEEELRLIQMQRDETDEEMEDQNMEESMTAERGVMERERSEREMEGSGRERSERERENSGRESSGRERLVRARERPGRESESSGREWSEREREWSGRERSERKRERSGRERSERGREWLGRESESSGREWSERGREWSGRESESLGRERSERGREGLGREWSERERESSGRARSERERESSGRERESSGRERSERERAKRERTDREREDKEKMLELEREAKHRQRDITENVKDVDHRTTKSSNENSYKVKISNQYKGKELTEDSFDGGSSDEYSDHSNPFANYKEIANEEKNDTKDDTDHTAQYSNSVENERTEWDGHYSPEEKAHCPFCGRRFVLDRLDTHTEICKKVYKRKRKVYDSAQKRAKGTDLENYQCSHKVIPAPVRQGKLLNHQPGCGSWVIGSSIQSSLQFHF